MTLNFPLDYLEWLKDKVRHPNYDPWNYNKLFLYLSMIPFRWSIQLDEDRATDGKRLRYRFGHEKDIPSKSIEKNLDISGCSVLEMLIALSLKCVETLTIGIDGYDQAGEIFWTILNNLDIMRFDDKHFIESQVKTHLDTFMDRKFFANGDFGGPFVVSELDSRYDFAKLDFFSQMQLYISSLRDWYKEVDNFGI